MILTLSMGEDYTIKSSIGGLHPKVVRAHNADGADRVDEH